jgi:hypothetical protein
MTAPRVVIDETVTMCEPPNNGAGPFWCYGSPLVVRFGARVFVSAMETGVDVPPLCNTRWRLFSRPDDGAWELLHVEDDYREREPCPLVGTGDGRLLLSVNPSIRPRGAKYDACEPHLIAFDARRPERAGVPDRPVWDDGGVFTDHSYRGVAADGDAGDVLLLNIDAPTGDQFWALREYDGRWTAKGRVAFPIRSCYPQVALRKRAGHILAIGDIVEPVEAWRAAKFERTGSGWDYVFRRLFYAYSPDVTKRPFGEPVEVETVEETCGHISNLDLWLDPDGAAHLLYLVRSVQYDFIRDRFLPGVPIQTRLIRAVVRDGEVVEKTTLMQGGEDASPLTPGYARFHAFDANTASVVAYMHGRGDNGSQVSENRLLSLGTGDAPVTIPLEKPFGMFFTATERGGNRPSRTLDLYGPGERTAIRYARVEF